MPVFTSALLNSAAEIDIIAPPHQAPSCGATEAACCLGSCVCETNRPSFLRERRAVPQKRGTSQHFGLPGTERRDSGCATEQTSVRRFTPTRAHLCLLYTDLQRPHIIAARRAANSLSGQTAPASILNRLPPSFDSVPNFRSEAGGGPRPRAVHARRNLSPLGLPSRPLFSGTARSGVAKRPGEPVTDIKINYV